MIIEVRFKLAGKTGERFAVQLEPRQGCERAIFILNWSGIETDQLVGERRTDDADKKGDEQSIGQFALPACYGRARRSYGREAFPEERSGQTRPAVIRIF